MQENRRRSANCRDNVSNLFRRLRCELTGDDLATAFGICVSLLIVLVGALDYIICVIVLFRLAGVLAHIRLFL
jgi:hypothetical protein